MCVCVYFMLVCGVMHECTLWFNFLSLTRTDTHTHKHKPQTNKQKANALSYTYIFTYTCSLFLSFIFFYCSYRRLQPTKKNFQIKLTGLIFLACFCVAFMLLVDCYYFVCCLFQPCVYYHCVVVVVVVAWKISLLNINLFV